MTQLRVLSNTMCHPQLAKRYYNAHALVDLSVSAKLGQTVSNGLSASAQGIEDVCIVISMPTVIEKGVHQFIRAC